MYAPDNATIVVEHAGVQGFAGFLEFRNIIGKQPAKKRFGIGSLDVENRHVGNVEHASPPANNMVFVELRSVVKRHIPATEIDDACAGIDVLLVERRFMSHDLLR